MNIFHDYDLLLMAIFNANSSSYAANTLPVNDYQEMSKHSFCAVLKQAGLLVIPKKKDSE